MRAYSVGPSSALIAIVGEAHGETEEQLGRPFAGMAGRELDGQLLDARINRSECYVTNVVQARPPSNKIEEWVSPLAKPRVNGTRPAKNKPVWEGPSDVRCRGRWVAPHIPAEVEALHDELRRLKPKVIIALGGTPLWALTAVPKPSITKWRGSHLKSDVEGLEDCIVLPTLHPAYVLRSYGERYTAVQDLRRAKRLSLSPQPVPPWNFQLRPSYDETLQRLKRLIEYADMAPWGYEIVYDLEIKKGEIVCVGLGWSRLDAICIPFYAERSEAGAPPPPGERAVRYFTPEQSAEVWVLVYRLLTHPNVRLVNQNLTFDIQFTMEDVGFWPKPSFDTMVAQHVLFPGEEKSLAYLASLYADYYVYWKDDGKFWDKPIDFPQLWHYNCLDCAYTFEVYEKQQAALEALQMAPQNEFMMRQLQQALRVMFRGIRVDRERKGQLARELRGTMATLTAEANYLAGQDLTGEKGSFSSTKLPRLFYKELALPPILKRAKGQTSVTCDDDAMVKIGKREPWLKPLCERINQVRSFKTALDVCCARTDPDGRWRSSLNIAGTENYRYSSSENPFGTGLNLQNITSGKDIQV